MKMSYLIVTQLAVPFLLATFLLAHLPKPKLPYLLTSSYLDSIYPLIGTLSNDLCIFFSFPD